MTCPVKAARAIGDRDPEIARLCSAWNAAERGSDEEAAAEAALRTAVQMKTETYRFGVADRFGRAIGAHVSTWTGGGIFFAHAVATRRGVHYGASQPIREFDTAERRDAWLKRYITTAEQRAQKRQGR